MDDYIAKPVDLERLCTAVARWLKTAEIAKPDEGRPGTAGPPKSPEGVAPPSAATVAAGPAAPEPVSHEARGLEEPGHFVLEHDPDPRPLEGEDDGVNFEIRPDAARHGEALPTLDLERLEEMCMGVASLRKALLDTFLAEIEPRLERITQAVRDGDPGRIEHEAHDLRGMLGTIGARAGAELFGALETLVHAGDVAIAGALLRRAVKEAASARDAIVQLTGRKAA